MQRTRATFEAWDTNGDGALDFKEVLCGCLESGMDPDEVSNLFAALDVNGDGAISLEEWMGGARAYRNAAHDGVATRPGASRLTTGVTQAFLRDLPAVIAKVAGGAFPEVRGGPPFSFLREMICLRRFRKVLRPRSFLTRGALLPPPPPPPPPPPLLGDAGSHHRAARLRPVGAQRHRPRARRVVHSR